MDSIISWGERRTGRTLWCQTPQRWQHVMWYNKTIKPCACLMCYQPAESKTQQWTLRDKLGWDLSHQSLMIWKLPTVKLFVAISPQSLQGEQTCPAAFLHLVFRWLEVGKRTFRLCPLDLNRTFKSRFPKEKYPAWGAGSSCACRWWSHRRSTEVWKGPQKVIQKIQLQFSLQQIKLWNVSCLLIHFVTHFYGENKSLLWFRLIKPRAFHLNKNKTQTNKNPQTNPLRLLKIFIILLLLSLDFFFIISFLKCCAWSWSYYSSWSFSWKSG